MHDPARPDKSKVTFFVPHDGSMPIPTPLLSLQPATVELRHRAAAVLIWKRRWTRHGAMDPRYWLCHLAMLPTVLFYVLPAIRRWIDAGFPDVSEAVARGNGYAQYEAIMHTSRRKLIEANQTRWKWHTSTCAECQEVLQDIERERSEGRAS